LNQRCFYKRLRMICSEVEREQIKKPGCPHPGFSLSSHTSRGCIN
jgi:hypothetical protein